MRFGALRGAVLLLGLVACGNGDDGLSCQTDDDCEAQLSRRACQDGRCVDPGCPAGMIYIGAGSYARGCPPSDMNCAAISQPEHQVTLTRGFCLSRLELTVADFRRCVAMGACQAPADLVCSQGGATWTAQPGAPNPGDKTDPEQRPISCLRWSDADAACRALGGRLPSEAEWEKAARGRDKRAYPHGSTTPSSCDGINWGGGTGCSGAPWVTGSGVGDQSKSAAGLSDMAGNLWEWTGDWFADQSYAACGQGCTNPTGPQSGVVRVRRGGSYLSPVATELRASHRDFHTPEGIRSDSLGARCAADLPPR